MTMKKGNQRKRLIYVVCENNRLSTEASTNLFDDILEHGKKKWYNILKLIMRLEGKKENSVKVKRTR